MKEEVEGIVRADGRAGRRQRQRQLPLHMDEPFSRESEEGACSARAASQLLGRVEQPPHLILERRLHPRRRILPAPILAILAATPLLGVPSPRRARRAAAAATAAAAVAAAAALGAVLGLEGAAGGEPRGDRPVEDEPDRRKEGEEMFCRFVWYSSLLSRLAWGGSPTSSLRVSSMPEGDQYLDWQRGRFLRCLESDLKRLPQDRQADFHLEQLVSRQAGSFDTVFRACVQL